MLGVTRPYYICWYFFRFTFDLSIVKKFTFFEYPKTIVQKNGREQNQFFVTYEELGKFEEILKITALRGFCRVQNDLQKILNILSNDTKST